MTPKFKGHIKEGKLSLKEEANFKKYLQTLDGDIELIVKKSRKSITTPQMRYYYGVIIRTLSSELGYTSDEMDLVLKFKFLKEYDVNGLARIPSKLELDTEKSEDYFSKIRMWASSELGIYIPLPNEVEY